MNWLAIVCIAVILVLFAGVYVMARAAAEAANDLERAILSAGEQVGNALATEPVNTAELTAQLAALERRITDVDDAADTRYRRLSARMRRAVAPDEPDEPTELPGQLGMDFATPSRNGATIMRPPPRRR